LGSIALLIGLIFAGLAVQEGRYEAGSEVVQGVVLDKAATYHTGRGSSSSWYVMYRFTTRNGETLEGKDAVFPNRWRALEEGGPVEVEYLASSPETNRIPGETVSAITYSAIGGVLLLAGAAVLARGRRKKIPEAPS
jgi:LPXTG-motif cell wall-anchored protein